MASSGSNYTESDFSAISGRYFARKFAPTQPDVPGWENRAALGSRVGLGVEPTLGAISSTLQITSSVTGRVAVRGAISSTLAVTSVVEGRVYTYGAISSILQLTSSVTGRVIVRGAISSTLAVTSVVEGRVYTYGAISSILQLLSDVRGEIEGGLGAIDSVFVITSSVTGRVAVRGAISSALVINSFAEGHVYDQGAISSVLVITSVVTGMIQPRIEGAISSVLEIDSLVTGTVYLAGAISSIFQITSNVTGESLLAGAISSTLVLRSSVRGRVIRGISSVEQIIANSRARRSGVYVEIADNNPTLNSKSGSPATFISERKEQRYDGEVGPGVDALSHISVVRMGSMRCAMAISSGDGVLAGKPNVVSVRVQSGSEDWGYPLVAFSTGDAITDITLLSGYNPILNINALLSVERTLLLVVKHGTDPDSKTTLLRSNNMGRTWVQVWQSISGRVRQPRLVQSTNGNAYLFFRDSNDDSLRYYASSLSPSLWDVGFAWDNPTAIVVFSLSHDIGVKTFDITHDKEAWVFAAVYDDGADLINEIAINTNAAPEGGTWVTHTRSEASTHDGIQYVRVGRVGGHNEFGGYPPGTVLVVYKPTEENKLYYSVFDSSVGVVEYGDRGEFNYELFKHQGIWQESEGGFFVTFDQGDPDTPPDRNKITNREVWNYRRTPSTSIVYDVEAGPGEIGAFVAVDNRGPAEDDEDTSDNFAGFWTRSNERHSIAFPDFDPSIDMTVRFKVQPYRPSYHNIWFVIEDPLQSDRPLFKMDYYVGRNTDPAGHPHDNARGCAIWFCQDVHPFHPQKTPADAPKGTFLENFHHPIPYLFQGFDDLDDNARVWDFEIRYISATDRFQLWWNPDGAGYVPFVPYAGHTLGDREYVDVGPNGASDEYVASSSDKYWDQPRAGMWPKRFYVGCPEIKPAFEQQSGMKVGDIEVMQVGNPLSAIPLEVDYAHCIVPRLSGGLDIFYVEGDQIFRQGHGWGWQDVFTVASFRSSWDLDGGPDQAEVNIVNVDNIIRDKLYENLKGYHVMGWVKAGNRPMPLTTDDGLWAAWVCPFFGTSDTGKVTETGGGDGPGVSMQVFSPLRDMTRSRATQGFTALEPPAVLDEEGVPTDVKDTKKAREWAILFMRDFDRPADPALPVDSLGRLMRWEDYIARYVWTDMLGLPDEKLEVDRVGFTPTTFAVNEGGGSADLLEGLRQLWTTLGSHWVYDYFRGGVFRVVKRSGLGLLEAPELILKASVIVSVPLEHTETDWGRAGNAITTASNMEQRPNQAVARVAPWPDGSGEVEEAVSMVNGLPSQSAFNLMYPLKMPLSLLERQWRESSSITIPIHAFPYLYPLMRVEIEVEDFLPATLQSRFAFLARTWFVSGVGTEFDPSQLVSTVKLQPTTAFGV